MQDEFKKKFDQFLEDSLFYEDLPGLAISAGIERTGAFYEGAAGYQDFITKEKLLPEHTFHMCSVTKLFAATAVLQLCERGKLKVTDTMVEILPWMTIDDKRSENITIYHLLTHTAGLSDVLDYGWDRPVLDEGALKRYVLSDEVRKPKLLWDPSENKFQYSNMGYEILGCIIAEASGINFDDYVMQNILVPLNMKNSTLLTFERTEKLGIRGDLTDPAYINESLRLDNLKKVGMAIPHIKNAQKHIIREPQYPYNREHGPSSTLTSNLADVQKWAKAHLHKGEILNAETYEQIWKEYALVPNNGEHIGLSWFIREQGGYVLYGHEGNDNGFRASFWICPEVGAHVIVLSNLTKAPVKKIGKKAFDLLLATLPNTL